MAQKPQYDTGWKEFSRRIRFERAEGRCECEGECGLHRTHPGPRRCVERDGEPAIWANGIVMLTVAHLEAGYAIGAGKPVAVLLSDGEPELMYKMARVFVNVWDIVDYLRAGGRPAAF